MCCGGRDGVVHEGHLRNLDGKPRWHRARLGSGAGLSLDWHRLQHERRCGAHAFLADCLDRVSMECEFTQTSVRRKLDADTAAKKLADARAEFASKPTQVSQKECAEYENLSLIMQGQKAAPDPQGMAKMSQREKADGLAVIGQMVSFVVRPTSITGSNWLTPVSKRTSGPVWFHLIRSNRNSVNPIRMLGLSFLSLRVHAESFN